MAVATGAASGVEVECLGVSAYTVPTDEPESDGTLEWDSTTLVLVEVSAGGETGLGYTYGPAAVGTFVESELADRLRGADPLRPQAAWSSMQEAIRNAGRPGVGAMAVSAVDVALWDLKARLLGVALAELLPRFHESAPVYGSGGFTSYGDARLREQLGTWAELGIPRVKIKVGRDPARDPHRLQVAREAVGADTALFVDANGAFVPHEALGWAFRYAGLGVTYLEEPVSSEDRAGLRRVRDNAPAGMAIAAGRRDAMRRDHEHAARGRHLQGAEHAVLRPLRAGDLGARLLRDGEPGAPGVLPRPRARGGAALRRDARSERRRAPPGPLAPGPRARAEARRRGRVRGVRR
jgi:L-alanine-DL-glutamate epimerase-like enolase superfamily enzyme